MDDWYARAVFFVSDGERSLHFYTEKLGFKVDWKFGTKAAPTSFRSSCMALR